MCNSRVIRSLSLLLLFSLFLTGFGSVNAKAATNLINPNLVAWDNVTDDTTQQGQHFMYIHREGNSDIFRVQTTKEGDNSSGTPRYVSWAIDSTRLVPGDTYTFTMHIPSPEEIRANTDYSHSDDYFANWIGDGFQIGFGGISTEGQLIHVDVFIEFTKSNYLSLAGTDYVCKFVCPDYAVSNPCIFIYGYTNWSPNVLFLDDSLCLVNDSAAEEEGFWDNLGDLITGFFHDLKWDLIGGACGDSNCNKTPHTSLSERISVSLSSLGDRISGFFENLSGWLTDVKEGIQSRLDEVKLGIQNKIGEIEDWLTNLRIELIKDIKSLFVPDEEYIKNWKNKLTNLLKDNLGIIYTAGDLITDLIEKVFDIVSGAPDDYGLSIPKLSFKASDGKEYTILDETEVSFDFMQHKVFKTMYGAYTVALYIFFGALEVKYAMRVYRKVMSN